MPLPRRASPTAVRRCRPLARQLRRFSVERRDGVRDQEAATRGEGDERPALDNGDDQRADGEGEHPRRQPGRRRPEGAERGADDECFPR